MIDWVNAVMPFEHTELIHGGARMEFDEHGEHRATFRKKKKAEGSFESTLAIQSSSDPEHFRDGKYTHIWVSGSPKPVQGHNLFGTDNPLELAALLALTGLDQCGHSFDPFTKRRLVRQWLTGKGIKFTIIDITQMLDVGTETDAAQFIEAASNQMSAKYRGRGRMKDGTFYIGQNSKRWALKLYRKFTEITSRSKKHKLPDDIPQRDALLEYARGTVRAELRLLSMQLKKTGLQNGEAWTATDALTIWGQYMSKIELSGNVRLHQSALEKLPRRLRSTYALWETGHDCALFMKRASYYAHRKDLLVYGIDISKPKVSVTNVVPLIRVIEARPKAIPTWAENTPLLARAA